MVKSKKPALLLVYGEGGHAEEMRRLLAAVSESLVARLALVAITEAGAKNIDPRVVRYNVNEVRDKQSGINLVGLLRSLNSLLKQTIHVFSANDVRYVLTTGPGLAIPVALFARLRGIKVLHVETCCRFYSKSITGRFMALLASEFWVQNEELLTLYPKAKYCGRL
ncbi:PssD/Cps14F family polysaccharide biosynthesis glycosyltransferase [Planctobacterium marinum]|uniref:Polysaccharide biosynthesis protein n=1 Tax=Planctobacterium marinum TaxID=1631968 RepID=A0AA48KRJ8_9ALTE|nr:hypothetical protein MACH26_31740 [Planctobacterium marinum]